MKSRNLFTVKLPRRINPTEEGAAEAEGGGDSAEDITRPLLHFGFVGFRMPRLIFFSSVNWPLTQSRASPHSATYLVSTI